MGEQEANLCIAISSSVAAVDEVAGRRRWSRVSCRRFETPASLLKDAFDLLALWLLEKDLLCCS
jgi:hypothetical protein